MKLYPSSFGDIYLSTDPGTIRHMLDEISYSKGFIICDTNTAIHCLPHLPSPPASFHVITLPAGEASKTVEECEHIWSELIAHHADRESIIINLGGGVISDLGGFAASCFQRGVRFIQIPTSLIAMTDASIGGKLGVDFKGYKNYVGLFNAAERLWINPHFLRTLPDVELRSGLAEVIKHAIIGSRPLWERLQAITSIDQLDWESILELSIPVKLRAVAQDPHDHDARKALNFGHTIGHALESCFLTAGTPVSHGIAVALGMMAESKMALDHGLLRLTEFEQVITLIERLVKPTIEYIPTGAQIAGWMQHDKKVSSGMISFSLPDGIGDCRWDIKNLDPSAAISWLQEHVSTQSMRLMKDYSND